MPIYGKNDSGTNSLIKSPPLVGNVEKYDMVLREAQIIIEDMQLNDVTFT